MENHIRQLPLASVKKKSQKRSQSFPKLSRNGVVASVEDTQRISAGVSERCKLCCFSNEGFNKLSLLHRENKANTVIPFHFLSILYSSFKNKYLSPVFIGIHLITRFNLQFFFVPQFIFVSKKLIYG